MSLWEVKTVIVLMLKYKSIISASNKDILEARIQSLHGIGLASKMLPRSTVTAANWKAYEALNFVLISVALLHSLVPDDVYQYFVYTATIYFLMEAGEVIQELSAELLCDLYARQRHLLASWWPKPLVRPAPRALQPKTHQMNLDPVTLTMMTMKMLRSLTHRLIFPSPVQMTTSCAH